MCVIINENGGTRFSTNMYFLLALCESDCTEFCALFKLVRDVAQYGCCCMYIKIAVKVRYYFLYE